MYSEVISQASIPHSPDLVYEQEVGNKRLSFGDMVTYTGSSGVQSYHESEFADIPLTQSGKYISCPGGGGQLNITCPDPLIDVTL